MSSHVPGTWHHGLVVDHRATSNLDAPEIDLNRNDEQPFEWLRSRVDAVNADDQRVRIRAETADGRSEEHALTMRLWYRSERVIRTPLRQLFTPPG